MALKAIPNPPNQQTFAEKISSIFTFNIFKKKKKKRLNKLYFFLTAAPNGGDLQNMFFKLGP